LHLFSRSKHQSGWNKGLPPARDPRIREGSSIVKSHNGVLLGTVAFLSVCAVPAVAGAIAEETGGADSQPSDSRAYKIGVVNRKDVFDNYNKMKAEYDELQKEVDKRQAKVDELSEKIEAQKTEYEEKKESMTEGQREEFEARVESDYRYYRTELDRLQRDINSMELRVVKKLFGEIDKAIAQVGADGDYHLVLDGTPKDASGSVIYYSPTLNMTQKVIEYINSHDMSESE